MIWQMAKRHGYHRWKMAWHIIQWHDIESYDFTEDRWPEPSIGYRCITCGQGFGLHLNPHIHPDVKLS